MAKAEDIRRYSANELQAMTDEAIERHREEDLREHGIPLD